MIFKHYRLAEEVHYVHAPLRIALVLFVLVNGDWTQICSTDAQANSILDIIPPNPLILSQHGLKRHHDKFKRQYSQNTGSLQSPRGDIAVKYSTCLCIFFIALGSASAVHAQTGIGTTSPDASARLDVSATDKGMLIPRVALTGSGDTATISNPATSLIVYNTNTAGDVAPGFYSWNGTAWERFFTVGSGASGGGGLTPVGTVTAYAGAAAPGGWLICDGAPVSRTAYPNLFAAIGTAYGPGDGVNTFNLPDLRGRVAVGSGAGAGLTNRPLGAKGGDETHQLTIAEMPGHNHGGGVHNHSASSNTVGNHGHSASSGNDSHNHSASSGSAGNHGHNFFTATHDSQSSGSQGYPNGHNHLAFRTTDRRQETRNNGNIHATGNHSHSVSINSDTHNHSITVSGNGNHSHAITVNNSAAAVSSQGGNSAHPIVQPFTALNYIIRAD